MKFAKLHGAGNDFLVFAGTAGSDLEIRLAPRVAAFCHRRLGVGADGVLLVVPEGDHRARVVYWNADGSPAAFCANGTRCAARFARDRWGWREMALVTGYADIPARVEGISVALDLPAPTVVAPWRRFPVTGGEVVARYTVVGVPHLVVQVDWPDFWERPLEPLAPQLRAHPELPAGGANVSFVTPRAGELAVRSWERGVEGETLSCGSGDVAAGLVALAEGWVATPARVRTASGRVLMVEPRGEPPDCPVRLVGGAEWVAEGEISPELLG